MKIDAETRVIDLVRDGVARSALSTMEEVVVEVEKAGAVRGVGCYYRETDDLLLAMATASDRQKEEVIAELLPPWWAELKAVLKRASEELDPR